jgi:hypothetical protein
MSEYEQADLEMMWIKLSFSNTYLILGIGYRNSALPVTYWDKLSANISEIIANFDHDKMLIAGDLKDDLLNPDKHHLRELIDSFSFHQLVKDPTRITPNSKTLLDPIIVGSPELVQSAKVLPQHCSDHCPITVSISPSTCRNTHKRNIWLYNQANCTAIKRELSFTHTIFSLCT